MKKIIKGSLILSMLMIIALPVYGSAITINIDNVPVVSDAPPELKDNRTMVPLRIISENLGALVAWSDGQVTLSKANMEVILKLGSKEVSKNGHIELLDVETYTQNNRTMVPLRFIAETFGATVDYQDSVVSITTKPIAMTKDMILTDLLKHPELIPYEPVLGGKMAFYKEESQVLSDKWVFAYFEDGHIFGHMLLAYTVDNGVIKWDVLDAYIAQ